jgi:hypothetical protein
MTEMHRGSAIRKAFEHKQLVNYALANGLIGSEYLTHADRFCTKVVVPRGPAI